MKIPMATLAKAKEKGTSIVTWNTKNVMEMSNGKRIPSEDNVLIVAKTNDCLEPREKVTYEAVWEYNQHKNADSGENSPLGTVEHKNSTCDQDGGCNRFKNGTEAELESNFNSDGDSGETKSGEAEIVRKESSDMKGDKSVAFLPKI